MNADELNKHLQASLPPEILEQDSELSELVDDVIASVDTVDCVGDTDRTNIAAARPADDWSGLLTPPESENEIGRLGGYRVLSVLGTGGMGVVFRAEDPHLKRIVALKAIRAEAGNVSDSARMRFLQEAQAAAAIEHDNIVTIYQVGDDRGTPFIAMQLLEGESLRSRLARKGALDPVMAVRAVRQITAGLAAAHSRGLIHRDIKPDNLWIESGTRRIRILDFGLAREISSDSGLTSSGMVVGTPAYLAPEQADGADVDERTDLFSLGVVFYEILTGHQPFRRQNVLATLQAISATPPKPPSSLNPQIPPAVSEVVLRLLSRDPNDRFQSATELAKTLRNVQSQLTRPQQTLPAADGNRFGGRGRVVAAALFGFVFLVLAGVFVYRLRDSHDGVTTGEWELRQYDEDVKVTIRQRTGMEPVQVLELERGQEGAVTLEFGTYEVEVVGGSDEVVVEKGKLEIRREGAAVFSLTDLTKDPSGPVVSRPNLAIRRAATRDSEVPSLLLVQNDWFQRGASLTMEGLFQGGETPAEAYSLEKRLLHIGGPGGELKVFRHHDNHLELQTYYDGPGDPVKRRTLDPVDFSRPVHLAVVYEPGSFRLYVDGKRSCQIDTQDLAAGWSDFFSINGTVGQTVDNVHVSRVVRYTADFDPRSAVTADADSLALFDFNNGPDSAITDGSGYDHLLLLGPQIEWSVEEQGNYVPLDVPPVPNQNYALQFEGPCKVVAGKQFPFTPDVPLTMECTLWVDQPPNANHAILSLTGSAGRLSLERTTSNHVTLRVKHAKGEHVLQTAAALERNRPIHVAATYQPGQAALFVAGQDSVSLDLEPLTADDGSKARFVIGDGIDFRLVLDEVRLSSVVRYEDESSPADRFEPDAQTEALYHCDDGRYRRLEDATGKNPWTHLTELAEDGRDLWVIMDGAGDTVPVHDETSTTSPEAPTHGKSAENSGAPKTSDAPPLAIAPFDFREAREHQNAWAEHLGVPASLQLSLNDETHISLSLIPPGEFQMGITEAEYREVLSDLKEDNPWRSRVEHGLQSEMPQHTVRIPQPFYLGIYEVTVKQFSAFVAASGFQTDYEIGARDAHARPAYDAESAEYLFGEEYNWRNVGFKQADNHPVVSVSWNDANAFCQWLSTHSGRAIRLPTEAEWEYACRAGTETRWWSGEWSNADLLTAANVAKYPNSEGDQAGDDPFVATAPVGSFQANGFGLSDMHGNVCEWCSDCFGPYTNQPIQVDPQGPASGTNRVFRGGAWIFPAGHSASAHRESRHSTYVRPYIGLRVAMSIDDPR